MNFMVIVFSWGYVRFEVFGGIGGGFVVEFR